MTTRYVVGYLSEGRPHAGLTVHTSFETARKSAEELARSGVYQKAWVDRVVSTKRVWESLA